MVLTGVLGEGSTGVLGKGSTRVLDEGSGRGFLRVARRDCVPAVTWRGNRGCARAEAGSQVGNALEALDECRALEAEQLGGGGFVAARARQGAPDQVALDLVDEPR